MDKKAYEAWQQQHAREIDERCQQRDADRLARQQQRERYQETQAAEAWTRAHTY